MKELDLVSDHVPVLLSNFSSLLPSTLGIWVDGTFGFGGYSRWLLESGATKVIAIDIDPDTLTPAFELEKSWPGKFKILAGNFCDMHGLVSSLGFKNVSGVVLDVGISSMHIDCPIRGFSITLGLGVVSTILCTVIISRLLIKYFYIQNSKRDIEI